MLGFLFKLAVLIVAGVLVYNYYLGSAEEKARSAKVFSQIKEVAVSVSELAVAEKEKFDAGKYDAALAKLAGVYRSARQAVRQPDADVVRRLGELEKRRESLQRELDAIKAFEPQAAGAAAGKAGNAEQQRRQEALRREMMQLLADTDTLLKEP